MRKAQQHGREMFATLLSQEHPLRTAQKATTLESSAQCVCRNDLRSFHYATIHSRVVQSAVAPSEQ
jgi:hypothetical protein